jgi:hypothetical protein
VDNQAKTKLDEVFEKHEGHKKNLAEARQIEKQRMAASRRRFEQLRQEIIEAVFEETVSYLREHGYDARITRQKDGTGRRARHGNASITLEIFTDNRRNGEHPFVSAVWQQRSGEVQFSESTIARDRIGHRGPTIKAKADQISQNMVREQVLKLMAQIFT